MQVAFIGGVADSSGYGWAIAKQLANAGATIIVGTWPPVLTLFERGIKKGFGEDSKLIDGSDMKIAKVAACLRQRTSGGQTLPACRAATRAWIYVVGRCGGGCLTLCMHTGLPPRRHVHRPVRGPGRHQEVSPRLTLPPNTPRPPAHFSGIEPDKQHMSCSRRNLQSKPPRCSRRTRLCQGHAACLRTRFLALDCAAAQYKCRGALALSSRT